jgi:hypothetical protein
MAQADRESRIAAQAAVLQQGTAVWHALMRSPYGCIALQSSHELCMEHLRVHSGTACLTWRECYFCCCSLLLSNCCCYLSCMFLPNWFQNNNWHEQNDFGIVSVEKSSTIA